MNYYVCIKPDESMSYNHLDNLREEHDALPYGNLWFFSTEQQAIDYINDLYESVNR